jgi:hypothetical protein
MTQGRIVAEGTPDELPKDLASAYLGPATERVAAGAVSR